MPISELLPPRVAGNREVLEKLSDQELMQVAIQLYREASLTIQACARNHAPAKLTDRSRAICCGLLVRLGKYMLAVDTLVTHQDSCADVLMAINRCMFAVRKIGEQPPVLAGLVIQLSVVSLFDSQILLGA
jgi:hypothetical protein